MLRARLAAEPVLLPADRAEWFVLGSGGDHHAAHQAIRLLAVLHSGLNLDLGRPAGVALPSTAFAAAKVFIGGLPRFDGLSGKADVAVAPGGAGEEEGNQNGGAAIHG